MASTSTVFQTANGFDTKMVHRVCHPGEVATGGGYMINAAASVAAQVTVTENTPIGGTPYAGPGGLPTGMPNGWGVWAVAPQGIGSWSISAKAVCTMPFDEGLPGP